MADTRVLIFTGLFEPGFKGGGPVRSLIGIMDTLPTSAEVYLITRDRDVGSDEPYEGVPSGTWRQRGAARVFYLDVRSTRQWLVLLRWLWSVRDAPVLYVNSFWERCFSILPIMLARLFVLRPQLLLIAPRGEFSSGALGLKAGRKGGFLKLWRRVLAGLPVLWHASTSREALDIQALFPRARIEIVMDQTSLPDSAVHVQEARVEALRLVFISRISPKKNLEALIRGLSEIEESVTLDIYGPKEDARYWSGCEGLIERLPPHISVRYVGTLTPSEVRRTFACYDAFVFPTLGENFGHVIAESLSAACPVLCPDTTPWTSVLKAGGGVVLSDVSASAVSEAVSQIAAMSPRERTKLRRRAGNAYEMWRREYRDVNVIERALERLQDDRAGM